MRTFRSLLLVAASTLSCQDPATVSAPGQSPAVPTSDTADTAPAPPPPEAPDARTRLIVGVAVPFTPVGDLSLADAAAQRAAGAAAVEQLVADLGGHARVNRRYRSIPFVALTVDAVGLARLEKDPRVTHLDRDDPKGLFLNDTTVLIGAPTAWSDGADGTGQAVAILDSGVASDHPFLAGKVVAEACFGTNDPTYSMTSFCAGGATTLTGEGAAPPCPNNIDGCDHGTHVAGIAAGRAEDRSGVAPGADVVAIQVFSRVNSVITCGLATPCPLTMPSDYIAALEFVLDEVQGGRPIAAANMSLGGALGSPACDSVNAATKAAIDNLVSVGTATVIASGNEASSAGVASPACISTAIAVGATNKADVVDTSYSNSGLALDLLAPGTDVISSGYTSYVSMTGTSMAAPHVAGAWAVMKSRTFDATVADVLDALVITGSPKVDPRNQINRPRIQLDAAVEALAPAFAPSYSPPGGDYVEAQTVTIQSESPEATLRYTLDGTTPTLTDGTLATSGDTFVVDRNLTVHGIAYTEQRTSIVSSAKYVIRPRVPTFDPPDSEWAEPVTVTLGSPTAGTQVRYTLDGSTPTASHGTLAPAGHTVELSSTTTVKAVAVRDDWSPSAVAAARYVIRGTLEVGIDPAAAAAAGARWRRGDVSVESFEDGNLGRFASTRSGSGSWSLRDGETPYGQWALHSPEIAAGTSASYAVTVECDGGRIRFARRVDSDDGADELTFAIDGTAADTWRGAVAWDQVSYPVSPGTHTFTWTWTRAADSSGGHSAAIDQLSFPGDQWRQADTSVPVYETSQRVLFSVVPAWDTPPIETTTVAPTTTRSIVGTYARYPAEPPSFSPIPGTYPGPRTLTMSTSTPGATIRYTLDGSAPSASSPAYAAPLQMLPGTTLQVRAYTMAPDRTDSPESSGTWVLTGTVDPVQLSPAPGTFESSPSVTMTTPTAGATIRYTMDGSAPTQSSAIWTAPVPIPSGDTTIRARAWREGLAESTETRGEYAVYSIGSLTLTGLTEGVATPGTDITLAVTGGVGPFTATSAPREDGVELDIDPIDERTWSVRTRAVGAFAGTWELLVRDEARDTVASITFQQRLRVTVDATALGAGQTVDVLVGGAARDETVTLTLIDEAGAAVSPSAATLPATATASGRTSDGNGATAVLRAGVEPRSALVVRVKATWNGLEAESSPIELLAPIVPGPPGGSCSCAASEPQVAWLAALVPLVAARRRRRA